MRNKLFKLPSLESDRLDIFKSPDLSALHKKFAARIIFKYNYFDLLNGDFSLLEKNGNRSLPEFILRHSISYQDKLLIPVLAILASRKTFDEDIRQRSAEILKMPWASEENLTADLQSEEGRIANAKNLLKGSRTPNTSDILRLLKDKPLESKKLAMYLIGKFRLDDMLPEICLNLFVRGLETDSSSVLCTFGELAGPELRHLFLKSSGSARTGNAILRLLAKNNNKDNSTFLFERLWSNTKETKETALNCLINCSFKLPDEESARFIKLISEVIGNIVWIISAKVCLSKTSNELLFRALNKEILQWENYLYGLLVIACDSGILNQTGLNGRSGNYLSEVVVFIFNERKKFLSDEKKLKKLRYFFPGKEPEYKTLADDLLNRDYNLLSVWLKVCTLRSITEIEDDTFGESAVALIFSPEEILRQEAAKLVARSSTELYRSVSQRIPHSIKILLDKIVNNETNEKELLFEKTTFLSSLFPEIPEDRLLFLSKLMKYTDRFGADSLAYPEGAILWVIPSDSTKPVAVNVIIDSDIYDNICPSDGSYIYILSLDAIEEFHYLYPEYSYPILKYIDDYEETERDN
jgi:hypothetical protein